MSMLWIVETRHAWRGFALAATGLIAVTAACAGQTPAAPTNTAAPQPSATSASAAQATATTVAQAQATPTRTPLKLLKLQPDGGFGGTTFTVTGEGLPANKAVDIQWVTWDGSFNTNVMAETIEFAGLQYTDRRTSLGNATTDAMGRLNVEFKTPVDYGGVHDVYVVADGKDIGRGGFQIRRNVTVSPAEGAIGTPITISITGIGKPPIEHAFSLRYDNQFSGFISGVTTRGTATAVVRAAGRPGLHTLELSGGGNHGAGYLNNQQSPYASLFPKDGAFRFTFNVTKDNGAPAATTEFPDASRVAPPSDRPRTTSTLKSQPAGFSGTLSTTSGAILTPMTVTGKGLAPSADFELQWVTAKGNRVTAAGWDLIKNSLGVLKTDASGALSTDIKAPDGLGGWHMVSLEQQGNAIAEIPFYVKQSLASISPTRVKAGEKVAITLKGVGWTELDNTVAMTYDNAYMGYACGFNSNGDVTIFVTATGGPGTHLVDIYPTTFQGKATGRWGFQLPQLTALEDHPGLSLGYSLPIFRLAIEIVE